MTALYDMFANEDGRWVYVDSGSHESCMTTATFLNQKPEGSFPFAGCTFMFNKNGETCDE